MKTIKTILGLLILAAIVVLGFDKVAQAQEVEAQESFATEFTHVAGNEMATMHIDLDSNINDGVVYTATATDEGYYADTSQENPCPQGGMYLDNTVHGNVCIFTDLRSDCFNMLMCLGANTKKRPDSGTFASSSF